VLDAAVALELGAELSQASHQRNAERTRAQSVRREARPRGESETAGDSYWPVSAAFEIATSTSKTVCDALRTIQ